MTGRWRFTAVRIGDPTADTPAFKATVAAMRAVPRGCRHLLAGSAPQVAGLLAAVICMQHRDEVACVRCAIPHLAGHDEIEERRCDLCGTVVSRIHGSVISLGSTGILRGLDGRKRRLELPVAVVGGSFGTCPPCRAALPDRAEDTAGLLAEALTRLAASPEDAADDR